MIIKKSRELEESSENPFAPSIGDLMAALLLIFVLLLFAALLQIKKKEKQFEDKTAIAEQYNNIVYTYKVLKDDLYQDLYREFKNDLPKWNAELTSRTLSIRFKEPDVLFEVGKVDLKDKFQIILNDFFPRYLKILRNSKYLDRIEEIRIEGHTSSEWNSEIEKSENIYILNMELSQGRTRSVLKYVLTLINDIDSLKWTKERLTANGLSSSKPIPLSDGSEDKVSSRRVEFRVRTNAEETIEILLKKKYE